MPHVNRIRSLTFSLLLSVVASAACQKTDPPKASVEAVSAPVAPLVAPMNSPSPVSDAAGGAVAEKKSKLPPAPTDGLSLAERVERRKADEAKLAAQLASDERKRLMTYDRGKLNLHGQVFAFITKARAELDRAKDREAVEKISAKQNPAIVATGKKLQLIDPKGGNSNVTTDYDVMLNALANDYPAALISGFDGNPQPLVEQRAELDKRTMKIDQWLRLLRSGH